MGVINVQKAEEYAKYVSSSAVTVVLFSADWAEQCKQILDVMDELSKKQDLKDLTFLNVSAEEFSEISLKHQVDAVPTVIYFRNNSAIDRIDGIDIAKLTEKCKQLANVPSQNSTGSLEDRLKSLINKSKVMIFMKGDRTQPRCGFSKQLIAIVNDTGITYETFDILTDEDVRQGLKTYSDWPTYPQVYVNGDLIGGLDIIKELSAGGELLSTLNG
ncbi:Glutaredoxin-3 [Pseudolycoriella hygida]|uniref:Glutaredoxin-3 n=1 Tax=Pseudolycoriella hygida TaxID=35572 RepID=A0A9Q0MSR5_9DIPT|nr:Glutaredoxin-3 [Pseudolycoriella hygida]